MKRIFAFLPLAYFVIFPISPSHSADICKIEKTVSLSPAPKEWGKTIPNSGGQLIYCKEPGKEFRGKVFLKGLTPNHNYKLVINDKKAPADGHGKLPKPYNNETHFDFQDIRTDGQGKCEIQFSTEDERLPEGRYDVKFFVKDWEAAGKPIVLYNDDIFFSIKK